MAFLLWGVSTLFLVTEVVTPRTFSEKYSNFTVEMITMTMGNISEISHSHRKGLLCCHKKDEFSLSHVLHLECSRLLKFYCMRCVGGVEKQESTNLGPPLTMSSRV